MVKEFVHDAPQRHTVVLDLHASKTSDAEVEDAVSAAGSVLGLLAREGLPLRLACTGTQRSATGFGGDEASYWHAMHLLATVQADGNERLSDALARLRAEREGLGEGVVLICRSLGEDLVQSVRDLRASGVSVAVVAIAAHTYRPGPVSRGPEAAFRKNIRRLEEAGAREVRVVRCPGGVAALAGGRYG
jgi:vacuolar-type H+-ATPase subunit F/Vma7